MSILTEHTPAQSSLRPELEDLRRNIDTPTLFRGIPDVDLTREELLVVLREAVAMGAFVTRERWL